MDCGSQKLCDVCEADQASLARINTHNNVGDELTRSCFILLDGKQIIGEIQTHAGWKGAVALLKPTAAQRIALVVDIPR